MCRDVASLFACLLGPAVLYYYPLLRCSRRRRRTRSRQRFLYPWNKCHEAIVEKDTWLNCMMETNYDEDLSQNAFFQTLQQEHQTVFDRAIGEGWIICIPRCGTFSEDALTEKDFLSHILVPDDEEPATQFHTLTDREVRLCNRVLTIQYDPSKCQSIYLLFEETFYTADLIKYCVWCIEGLLKDEISVACAEVPVVNTLKECINLLWTEVDKNVLHELDEIIEEFAKSHNNLEKESLQVQTELVSVLYTKSLRTLLKSTKLRERTIESHHFLQTIKLATETYVLHGLRKVLPQAVSFRTASEDASLNKIIKNLQDLQLQDLSVRADLYDGVLRGKSELARLDCHFTSLGKINCVKRVARFVSQGESSVSSDDLLPVLIFLVVKSGLANWYAQLTFMKQFRYSSNAHETTDEAGFLITSLEAAVEHVKSGSLTFESFQIERRLTNRQGIYKNEISSTGMDETDVSGVSANELFEHAKKGNLKEVQRILSERAEGASNETKLCHPLCLCESCERSLSRSSLSDLSTVLVADERGLTCLHVASVYGQVSVVDYLLQQGADPNERDTEGISALHCAATRGHQNTLLLLLHANADPNAIDAKGNSALHLAADHGHDACVKALLYFAEQARILLHINTANLQGDTALHFASKWGYTSIVEILLEYGTDLNLKNRRGQTPLSVAHSSHIARLLEGSISRTSTPTGLSEYTPMRKEPKAETGNHSASVGIAAPTSGTLAYRGSLTDGMHKIDRLFAAVAEGDIRLASYYLGLEGPCSKTYVSEQNEPKFCHPLCNCDKCVSIEELAYERETKPPIAINAVNSKGETALHIASAAGCIEIIQVLLDAGAKVNTVTRSEGRTPLHLACLNDRAKVVKMLLECGACNSDAKDNARDTPLHLSARAGNVRIVEMLVRHGANTRLRNLDGATALEEVERIRSDDIFMSLALSNIAKILKNVGPANASQ
ncbi:PREDICTED: ankyrin repeat domain-containing protein 27-like [Ceratosolen solmsi marchali]|uniref:Ankyrin repeat domain-containing protein 27-like n=1 Tax=Ceratosolen solmsi marchali TaxID=326594 RepID=A0AAJ7DUC1_9HYME|nr:PREDICTED: ankyrin repeat domain-containing protein 27-like [Ceratosolen solmsi marchali]